MTQQLLKISPANVTHVIQQALMLHQQQQLSEAEKLYNRVLKVFPDHPDALHLLGMLKLQSGKAGEALKLVSAALKMQPRSADVLSNLGLIFRALKRNADALASFDKAVALDPHHASALNNRGNALLDEGLHDDALACFDKILSLRSDYAEARIGRGNALFKHNRNDEALGEYDKVISLFPGHPAVHFNRGNALFALDRLPEANAAYEQSLAINPNNAKAWNARGVALQQLTRNPEAIGSFEKAIALDAGYADAHFNMGLSLLALGDYPRGFAEYEWRWTRTGMSGHRSFGKPLWDGDYPLERRTILLHAEQGLGDTIQFARYVPLLAKTGARIVIEVQPELKNLISGIEGAVQVIARDEKPPAFDVHCPLARLPLAFKTGISNVPANIPYLKAADDKVVAWRKRLANVLAPRVALVWSGNVVHPNDRNRSIALSRLIPLLAVSGLQFISLQHEPRPEDFDILQREPRILHLGGEIRDFADTAALLTLVDALITVDTSVAHVAAAMGRPVWLLLPHAPDWRWTLDQAASPWYPQARLYRQPAIGDWTSVTTRLFADLAALPKHAAAGPR